MQRRRSSSLAELFTHPVWPEQNRPTQSISTASSTYQTCSFTFFPSTSMVFTLKSMPGRGERDREEKEKQERDNELNTSDMDSKHTPTCIYRSVCPGRRFIPTGLWWNVSLYACLNMGSRVSSVPAAVWSHSAVTSLHVLTLAALEGAAWILIMDVKLIKKIKK